MKRNQRRQSTRKTGSFQRSQSRSKEMNSLEKLLVHELKDLYHAEKQLVKALGKLAKAATHEELKSAFEQHLEQTKNQVNRLEQAFEIMGQKASSIECKGIKGIVEEGEEILKEKADPQVLDAALIGAAQKAEHYEIAAYGTACTFAETLGQSQVKDLLGQTLSEEKETDERLTEIAESFVNAESVKGEKVAKGEPMGAEETEGSKAEESAAL